MLSNKRTRACGALGPIARARSQPRRPAVLRAVLDLREGRRNGLRPRLLVLRGGSCARRDPRSLAREHLGRARGLRPLDAHCVTSRRPHRLEAPLEDRSGGDGHDAVLPFRAHVLARPGRALPLRAGHRTVPSRRGSGHVRAAQRGPAGMVRVADLALDRPRPRVRRPVRTTDRREPSRSNGAGLRPHRPREGAAGAPGRPATWHAGGADARHHARRPRPGAPPRRDGPRGNRLQHSRASGAMPSRRSRTATCPRSRASSCSARSSSCSRSWSADILYAVLDPRVRY